MLKRARCGIVQACGLCRHTESLSQAHTWAIIEQVASNDGLRREAVLLNCLSRSTMAPQGLKLHDMRRHMSCHLRQSCGRLSRPSLRTKWR